MTPYKKTNKMIAYPLQLYQLADKNATDKGTVGPSSKWSANNYADVYEAYFHRIRFEKINFLEIGLGVKGDRWKSNIAHGKNVEGGGSMRMWSEYFPKARLFGLDINDASFLDTDRISTFIVDQGDRKELTEFLDNTREIKFDYIVDDGSHRADHQQVSLEILFPTLKSGGIYFIEDLNDRGYGERSGGVHSADHVVSTRNLFQQYRMTGEIISPNSFENTSFLSEIESVLFYTPRPFMRFRDVIIETIRVILGRNTSGMIRTEFNPTSHKIVAIHKGR